MSVINAVTGVTGAATTPQRPSAPRTADRPAAPAQAATPAANPASASTLASATKAPAKQPVPMRYFGGIDGMNAANLIVALQANGTVSGGYSAQAIETGGTPPPTIVEKDA